MELHGAFNIGSIRIPNFRKDSVSARSLSRTRRRIRTTGLAVRKNTIVMVGIAVVFGLLAVFVAQGWLNYQAELSRKVGQPKAKPVATRTIVIAAGPMRFGAHVSADSLREVEWPDAALPAGTFGSIAEVMSGGKRIVLASIEKNEPLLRTKITGAGQKATLSAVIQDGMRAVTVRVNDVEGVGGFVLPGDHVDVLLTRQQERTNGTNDVVIQNARVLAVDQLADDAADRPTVVKAVTIEVDTVAAQKIALAASLGNLSLMLRRAGEQVLDSTRRITTSDLTQTEAIQRAPEAKRFAKVSVTRGTTKQEYNVASEEAEWREGSDELAARR
jgi:pilus assembly protein CpaB